MCEYCDGESNPTIMGAPLTPKLLFCIRGRTHWMSCDFCERRMDYLLSKHMNFCCMCGDALKPGVFPTHDRLGRLNGSNMPEARVARTL